MNTTRTTVSPTKIYFITCPACPITFPSYSTFSSHNKNDIQQEVSSEKIINSISEFEEFIQEMEISSKINFNRIPLRNNILTFHCNFRSDNKFTCPFFSMRTQYENGKIFINKKYLSNNHVIDFNNLKIVRREKNKLKALISSGRAKQQYYQR